MAERINSPQHPENCISEKKASHVLVLFAASGYNFYEVIEMSKGRDIAGFVLGIIIALCGAAIIVLNAFGMHEDY